MSGKQSILGVNDEAQETKPAVLPVATAQERRFEVLEAMEVPRGHHRFLLPRGQVVSSHGYDVEELRRAGVKLRELKP
jgi:hypothetical protein